MKSDSYFNTIQGQLHRLRFRKMARQYFVIDQKLKSKNDFFCRLVLHLFFHRARCQLNNSALFYNFRLVTSRNDYRINIVKEEHKSAMKSRLWIVKFILIIMF